MAQYPFIDCMRHGHEQSYVACFHIVKHGARVVCEEAPTDDEAGVLTCVAEVE